MTRITNLKKRRRGSWATKPVCAMCQGVEPWCLRHVLACTGIDQMLKPNRCSVIGCIRLSPQFLANGHLQSDVKT
jgi:hypothetical protein